MAEPRRVCINAGDDLLHGKRPAPYGGPKSARCTTCWRAFRKAGKIKARTSRVRRVYGLREGEYEALKSYQGGRCAICQVATGASRQLAVDHDHNHCVICHGDTACGEIGSIRGLLCATDNVAIGQFSILHLIRMIRYKMCPPGPGFLAQFRRGSGGFELPETYRDRPGQTGHLQEDLFEGNHRGGPRV